VINIDKGQRILRGKKINLGDDIDEDIQNFQLESVMERRGKENNIDAMIECKYRIELKKGRKSRKLLTIGRC
jgi:hypothetical protein